jgi:hypothetical protein
MWKSRSWVVVECTADQFTEFETAWKSGGNSLGAAAAAADPVVDTLLPASRTVTAFYERFVC